MKATNRTVENIEIISLQGKITIGSGDTQLREVISNAVSAGKTNVLLDLSGVTTIDSSGIGELV
ncbi:MAG: anti-sigma factor antagonist, partial [Acidobacteriota bacterium]|nr:anti-sigma factor antagonist [Acidobacteriota bacterium]